MSREKNDASRAEDELADGQESSPSSRERLSVALDAAHTGTFRWDTRADTIESDARLDRLCGLGANEAARSLVELLRNVHDEDRAETLAAFGACAREGTGLDIEFRVAHPGGSVRWLAARGRTVRGDDGLPAYVTGACLEITRRKLGDDALRASAERLQVALAAGQLGDWTWDAASDALMLSERACAIFGLPPGASITWTTLRDLLHEEHREQARRAVEAALAEHGDYDIEYRVRRPSGEDCWIAARGRGLYDKDGAVLGMIGVVQDVSRRKATEDALRQGADTQRITFDQAAVGIATASPDGRFLETNRKFGAILGYTAEELRGMTFLGITHPDDAVMTAAEVGRLLRGEVTDFSYEKRYVRKDGAVIWSLTTVTLVRDEAGRPARFVGVIEDISRRRETEDALRRSEQFNRTIIESSRDCIKTLSLDGEILWISSSGCRLLAVDDPRTVVGSSYPAYWEGEDRAAAERAIAEAARGGTGSFVGSTTIAGRRAWFDVVVTPIHGPNDTATTLLAVSRDVTERMQAESAFREESRVLSVLNRTGAALASQLDLPALLQQVTDAATELSGARFGAFFYNTTDENGDAYQLYTLSGAPRAAFERFGHPRATPMFAPTFRGDPAIRIDDVRADPRYGQWAPHHGLPPGHLPVRSYLAVPVISRSGEVIGGLFFGHPEVGVFTERSEHVISGIAAQAAVAIDNARLLEAAQKAAEERRQLLESERVARSQAERVSATKDEFLAVVSHELRTPLNAILGWAHMLRSRRVDDDVAKGLEIIERNARAQTQLIDDLLDMSRIASGKMRLDVQSVAPPSFIEAAVETVRPGATAKGVRLELVLDPGAGPVMGDPGRLQQVVWNLLSNAIKFTPKGGRVQVVLERVNSHVEISVADTGAGIPEEFIDYVFERFRQADASSTRKHGGLGLGLAIVKHLVELHGGSVHVKSPGVGLGTTFTVKLPLTAVQRYDEAAARVHPGAAPAPATRFHALDLSGLQVLVVDDEPDARELVARVLGDCGARVLGATSAVEAIALVESQRPDVLVSDIGMPDVDGFELLRRVRALGAARGGRLPAIALTAFARSEDRTRALSAGFLVHLTKPIEPSELVASVATVAGRTGGG